MPLLSIVIPCYNEEQNLSALYGRLRAILPESLLKQTEILLVDDGSQDGTWAGIEQLCATDTQVTGIRLSRNFGHQVALTCGLEHARGERIMIIDADLQDPPELIPAMMARMDEGFDVVYGRRRSREGETLFKKSSAWLFYRVLAGLSDVHIPKDTGDFRLISRKVADALRALPERVRFTRGLISWLGFRQTALDYARQARHAGKTHYSLTAMIRFANEGLTSFSTRPLQLTTWLGVLMFFVSLALLAYVFISWVLFNTVRGWTSIMAIFLLFQSIQWLILGIIGNYLAVIFRETKLRPLYVIDQVIKNTAP